MHLVTRRRTLPWVLISLIVFVVLQSCRAQISDGSVLKVGEDEVRLMLCNFVIVR